MPPASTLKMSCQPSSVGRNHERARACGWSPQGHNNRVLGRASVLFSRSPQGSWPFFFDTFPALNPPGEGGKRYGLLPLAPWVKENSPFRFMRDSDTRGAPEDALELARVTPPLEVWREPIALPLGYPRLLGGRVPLSNDQRLPSLRATVKGGVENPARAGRSGFPWDFASGA